MIRNMFENYFLKNENPYDLLKYVLSNARSKRPIINPNKGFINQLINKIKEYQLYQ